MKNLKLKTITEISEHLEEIQMDIDKLNKLDDDVQLVRSDDTGEIFNKKDLLITLISEKNGINWVLGLN